LYGYASLITDCANTGIVADKTSEATEFPQLDTDRPVLRELALDNVDIAFPHFANKEVVRYEDSKPAANVKDVY
jgi:hypothetical protein